MSNGEQAVARLYQAWFTGAILRTIVQRGSGTAADLVRRIFRRQRLATFLPGLRKLGLDHLPAAVAAAQYHYLSNQLGGVRVEYIYESDRKAWIRYPPPRWIWAGTAICAVPSEVSAAMLRGWHAENGLSLGNLRLGFVCTKQTVDGDDALEGYFCEYDHALAPEERLRFAHGETAPLFDPAAAPRLPDDDWPVERRQRAGRNYAMEYIRTMLTEALDVMGPREAKHLIGGAAYLVGLQFYDECRRLLGRDGNDAESFAAFFRGIAQGQGDDAAVERSGADIVITQQGWRLARGLSPPHQRAAEIWNELWRGCLAAHDPTLRWRLRWISAENGGRFEWRMMPSRGSAEAVRS
ncbi:MAG TPA: hypothetical protein VGU20_27175 [Stellaceae bacterium]|nr:hypothetical protein [Stellaceae bacterium]